MHNAALVHWLQPVYLKKLAIMQLSTKLSLCLLVEQKLSLIFHWVSSVVERRIKKEIFTKKFPLTVMKSCFFYHVFTGLLLLACYSTFVNAEDPQIVANGINRYVETIFFFIFTCLHYFLHFFFVIWMTGTGF